MNGTDGPGPLGTIHRLRAYQYFRNRESAQCHSDARLLRGGTGLDSVSGNGAVHFNQFSNHCNGGFIQNYLFTFPKDPLYAGTGYWYWYQFGLTARGKLVDTVSPANPEGAGDHPSAELITNSFNILWNRNDSSNVTSMCSPLPQRKGSPHRRCYWVTAGGIHWPFRTPASGQYIRRNTIKSFLFESVFPFLGSGIQLQSAIPPAGGFT